MMGCNTWKLERTIELLPKVFGIELRESSVQDYLAAGREPRAFVGWDQSFEIPGGRGWSLADIVDHIHFTEALAALFSRWMVGQTIEECMLAFERVALGHGFDGIDSWRIAGCRDLRIDSGL